MLLNVPEGLLQSTIQMLYIVICVPSFPCGCINRVNRSSNSSLQGLLAPGVPFSGDKITLVKIPFLVEIFFIGRSLRSSSVLLPQKSILVLKIAPAEVFLNCLEMIVCHLGICLFISSLVQQKHNLLFSFFLNLKILSAWEIKQK